MKYKVIFNRKDIILVKAAGYIEALSAAKKKVKLTEAEITNHSTLREDDWNLIDNFIDKEI